MAESEPPPIGLCAQAACILEVASFKPGNVNFVYAFSDMCAVDFILSAAAIAPVLEQAPLRPIGDTILDCIRETQKVTKANTNLGIVLLLAPLASVPFHIDLRGGVSRALIRLDVADARAAYEAICLANPGGLGEVDEQDVRDEPTVTLREAMALAADRDTVARQYVNDFEQVFEGSEILREELGYSRTDLAMAISRLYLRLLAAYPDSLIARRHGRDVADEVSRRAKGLVQSQPRHDLYGVPQFHDWLRSGGKYPLNPGTTADLVTAALFVALRRNIIQLPLSMPSVPGR